MILLVGFYGERSAARAAELAECLRRNCESPHVDEVHVFLEEGGEPDYRHPKIRMVPIGRRLLYRDLCDYANRKLNGRQVIIANSDIYFDQSLKRIGRYDLGGQLLCLSRWDVQTDGSSRLFEFASSQDAWIFAAPIREFRCDWHLGMPGCENRLAYEAERAGLRVSNPSRSVRAHHLHLSRVIHYRASDRVHGPGLSIEPAFLGVPSLWLREEISEAQPADAVCFLDGKAPADDFEARVLPLLDEGNFFVAEGALVCKKGAFDRAGGADDNFADHALADADLQDRLRRAGLEEKPLPPSLLCPAPPAASSAAALAIDQAYLRAKRAVLDETAGAASPLLLRELNRAVARRVLGERGVGPDLPCAQVAFREAMGYTLARVAPGVSSHNNDPRPFVSVAPRLAGLCFTQVVASRVSPVDVRFLTAGKLYVLVGTDWDGYRLAVAWLRDHGFREGIPPLETGRGTAFEVWSLVGAAGEEMVLPTQMMLVSDHLERRA